MLSNMAASRTKRRRVHCLNLKELVLSLVVAQRRVVAYVQPKRGLLNGAAKRGWLTPQSRVDQSEPGIKIDLIYIHVDGAWPTSGGSRATAANMEVQ